MIRRSTVVMLAVFVVLLGVMFYLQRNKPAGTANSTPTTPAQLLFDFQLAQVKNVKIQDDQGGLVALSRADASTWKLDQPAKPINNETASTALNQIGALYVTTTLDPAPDAEATGLARPAYTMTLTLDDNSNQLLFIGKTTPIGDGYYVQKPRGKVQIVSTYGLEQLTGLVKTPPILSTPTPEVSATSPVTGTLPLTQTINLSNTLPLSGTVPMTATLPVPPTPTVAPTGTITPTVTATTTNSP